MLPLRGLAWGAYAGLLAGVRIAMMIIPIAVIASAFEADPSLPTGFYDIAIYAMLGLTTGLLVGAVVGGVLGFLYTAVQLDQYANWVAGLGLALVVVWFSSTESRAKTKPSELLLQKGLRCSDRPQNLSP